MVLMSLAKPFRRFVAVDVAEVDCEVSKDVRMKLRKKDAASASVTAFEDVLLHCGSMSPVFVATYDGTLDPRRLVLVWFRAGPYTL